MSIVESATHKLNWIELKCCSAWFWSRRGKQTIRTILHYDNNMTVFLLTNVQVYNLLTFNSKVLCLIYLSSEQLMIFFLLILQTHSEGKAFFLNLWQLTKEEKQTKSFNILSSPFLLALLTLPLFHSFLLPPPPHMCIHTFVLLPSSTTALTGCEACF